MAYNNQYVPGSIWGLPFAGGPETWNTIRSNYGGGGGRGYQNLSDYGDFIQGWNNPGQGRGYQNLTDYGEFIQNWNAPSAFSPQTASPQRSSLGMAGGQGGGYQNLSDYGEFIQRWNNPGQGGGFQNLTDYGEFIQNWNAPTGGQGRNVLGPVVPGILSGIG